VIPVPLSGSDDPGVPVGELVTVIKQAIKLANVSVTNPGRDLAVTSVRLRLHTVATRTAGGSIDFRVPVIGVRLKMGSTVTRHNSHLMEMTLVPDDSGFPETRGAAADVVLVEAIETIRAVMARAAEGDDPFTLKDSAVELEFGVAADGTISLGIDGELKDELTHTMRLTVQAPAQSQP
jgi:hypothetical protein